MKPPLLLALLLTAVPAAPAQVYRWVDENGVTVYSTTPPPSGEVQRIKPPPPPAEDPGLLQRRMEAQHQAVEDLLEDRELARQQDAEERLRRTTQASNCQAARANLERLSAGGSRLMRQPDGSYLRFSEEERQQRVREAQDQVGRYCR